MGFKCLCDLIKREAKRWGSGPLSSFLTLLSIANSLPPDSDFYMRAILQLLINIDLIYLFTRSCLKTIYDLAFILGTRLISDWNRLRIWIFTVLTPNPTSNLFIYIYIYYMNSCTRPLYKLKIKFPFLPRPTLLPSSPFFFGGGTRVYCN